MYQILPFKTLLLGAAWVTLAVIAALNWGQQTTGLQMPAKYAISAVSVLLLLLAWKGFWRTAWRFVKPLRDWFPDLNGLYDVELQHNWPIQQRLLEAAATGQPFDPRHPDTIVPELGSVRLKAKIELGFYSVRMTMWSETTMGGRTVIDRSRSISTTLIRPCDGHPHRLAYTYQQVNRRDRVGPTDDTVFEGSAVLNIEDVESGTLSGQYWTNRAWHKGLSTAGNIILTRTSTKV